MPAHVRAHTEVALWLAVMCFAGVRARAQAPATSTAAPGQTVTTSERAAAQAQNLDGERRVVKVRVVTNEGVALEENPATLPLQPGHPLDSEVIRESVRQLFRTGRYADIRAERSVTAEGLQIDFVVEQNFYINLVRALGLREPPGEPLALSSLRLSLGQPFRDSTLKDALDRLRQTLHEEGLYQAELTYQLLPHADTRQMDITVQVTPGPRSRFGTIEFHNHSEFADAELISRTKLKPSIEVTSARLEHATNRLRKFLVANGYLAARITLQRGEYDAKANKLPLTIDVASGPKVRVQVSGAKISSRQLRKILPIYQEGAVDEDLLQEGRRDIREYMERDGYFDADVSVRTTEPSAGEDRHGRKTPEELIVYHVERGKRHRLVGIGFDGNKYFSQDLLRARLRMFPAAFLSRGRFSRRLLQADTTSIRELYVSNGFREADVRNEVIDDYQGKEGDIFLRFRVTEGEQTRVASLEVEGNKAFSTDQLRAVIGSTEGQAYSEFNISSDRDNILAVYYNEGFPAARFTATVEESGAAAETTTNKGDGSASSAVEPKTVRLIYRIVEGTQVKVERVLVGGYEHTHRNIINREVQVKAGEPLRESEVVKTQRRLYNLGVFSRVSIAPQDPAGTEPAKTVVVLAEEGSRYTLAYGGGFEVQRLGGGGSGPVGGAFRVAPRGIFELTKINFTGRADALSFKIRASTLQGRALLSYTAPNYFGKPAFSLQLTGFADRTRDILTFTSTRYEGSVQLAQRVSPVTSFLYRYSFRKVLVDPKSLRISPEQIPLFSQPTQVSLVGGTWIRERRDNPADATRGSFNTVDLGIAGKRIGSSASFVRLFAQNSTFYPLKRRYSFARSVRVGIQEPFPDTRPEEIPLPERFFAGGGNSLRGFGLNQAGPRDPKTGFPVGGQALIIFNQELRFPMKLPYVGSRLGGALFYDAGNIFSNVRRITLRPIPSAPTNLNYFSHTIGLGLRYGTPIGPLRVDLGYQLNAAKFCVPGTAGAPAPPGCATGQKLTRLPRFQFFFNLGSIF